MEKKIVVRLPDNLRSMWPLSSRNQILLLPWGLPHLRGKWKQLPATSRALKA